MIGLTPRQRDCLAFYRANPNATLKQAGRHLGLASANSVHALITRLEQRGYVRRNRGRVEFPVTIRGEAYRFIPMETS